jgi:hypothetical protein
MQRKAACDMPCPGSHLPQILPDAANGLTSILSFFALWTETLPNQYDLV